MNPILVLLIVFVVTLILGVPFAWSLLLASAASVCMIDGLPLMQIASKMYNGVPNIHFLQFSSLCWQGQSCSMVVFQAE